MAEGTISLNMMERQRMLVLERVKQKAIKPLDKSGVKIIEYGCFLDTMAK